VSVAFRPAEEADFERLLDLSVRTMRADLERVGRFDPARRRARMRGHFEAGSLRVIEAEGAAIGCLGLYPREGERELHSFFLEPAVQGRGLGAAVFTALRAGHPGQGWWIEVLKGSAARGFWERQGFVLAGESAFDWIMRRPAD
jgi:N-acetylglutamate synthase-like GNAT family acetyltransferase